MKVVAPPNIWYYQKLGQQKLQRLDLLFRGLSNYYWSSSQNNTNNAYNANFNNGYINNNNVNNNNYVRLSASFIILNKENVFQTKEGHFFNKGKFMKRELTFEELYEAYNLCLKNKKRKMGTFNFVNDDLCKNLLELLDESS